MDQVHSKPRPRPRLDGKREHGYQHHDDDATLQPTTTTLRYSQRRALSGRLRLHHLDTTERTQTGASSVCWHLSQLFRSVELCSFPAAATQRRPSSLPCLALPPPRPSHPISSRFSSSPHLPLGPLALATHHLLLQLQSLTLSSHPECLNPLRPDPLPSVLPPCRSITRFDVRWLTPSLSLRC